MTKLDGYLSMLHSCLEVIESADNLVCDLPQPYWGAPLDVNTFDREQPFLNREAKRQLSEFQYQLDALCLDCKYDEEELFQNASIAANELMSLLQKGLECELDEYRTAFWNLDDKVEVLRRKVDEILATTATKANLLALFRRTVEADEEAECSPESLFDEKLNEAAEFIRENGSAHKGVKGIVVARHIDVTPATFRRHYVPALKAKHRVENDGNGYYALASDYEIFLDVALHGAYHF